ncbi:MAG: CBM35 domain-containing protein [Verrucomicrobiota bacterium]
MTLTFAIQPRRLGAWSLRDIAWLCFLLIAALSTTCQISVQAATLTLNVDQRGGDLKKAGLGTLFGVVSNNVGPWKFYLTNSLLFVSEHQGRIGDNGRVPPSTEAVAPVIRGTKIKMICRFGDLCYGWAPYKWPGLDSSWLSSGTTYSWMQQVTNACYTIKTNYLDVVYAIAIFNEPETQLVDANFLNDPNIQGTTQLQRMNFVWAKTHQVIRSILPTVKIMGPNYVDYRPQYYSSHQTMMRDFLTNAMATGTVPDVIGWHSLYDGNPTGLRIALQNYYSPLEISLGVPGAPLPMACEEYGINNGAFEGIPGQVVRYWAEFERAGVDFGCMGIYQNGGDLGNIMRGTMWDNTPEPNAGWFMFNWYLQMQGEYIPIIASGIDGVASWNSTNQTLTCLFGGADGNTSLQVNGIGALGMGSTVRVRLDMAYWTTNSNVANDDAACGGDPQSGGYNIYDRNFNLNASGNITIPVNAVEGVYHGYRVTISPAASPDVYPTKYEAEQATYNHVVLHNGADGQYQASGGAYLGGIDFPDSLVCFRVTAPSNGLYDTFIRYAAGLGGATHNIIVNGQPQGAVFYPGTIGWANAQMRTAVYPVSLVQGMNEILFTRGTNFAELDFIDVRASRHFYEAELATNNHVNLKSFNTCYIPNCVGNIDFADSYVDFGITVPVTGAYNLRVAYGNGSGSTATHLVTVNGTNAGSVSLPPSGGWLGGGWLSGSNPSLVTRTSTLPVTLTSGFNTVRLTKGNNWAELDYIFIQPASNLTPAVPMLSITRSSATNVTISWPTPGTGYWLQQISDPTKTNWSNVMNAISVVGNQNQVTVPLTSSNTFFRLFP